MPRPAGSRPLTENGCVAVDAAVVIRRRWHGRRNEASHFSIFSFGVKPTRRTLCLHFDGFCHPDYWQDHQAAASKRERLAVYVLTSFVDHSKKSGGKIADGTCDERLLMIKGYFVRLCTSMFNNGWGSFRTQYCQKIPCLFEPDAMTETAAVRSAHSRPAFESSQKLYFLRLNLYRTIS